MKKTEDADRTTLEKKLILNKETIRVLTEREMMEVEGATCLHGSTCLEGPPTSQCH